MRCFAFPLLVGTLLSIGCNKGTSPPDQAAAPVNGTPAPQGQVVPRQQPIAVPATATPDQVVTVFLNSLRGGDSATTESLLTNTARQELAKHSLSVDVQSAPNATYQVQPAEILQDPTGAHVKSVWTEKFDDGDETYEIIWALRHQPEGWRLAGMAMELLPGQPMQFLNFEDPQDMLKKKDEAIAAMQPPAIETAQQPPPANLPASRPIDR
jgi:hypothetical protein